MVYPTLVKTLQKELAILQKKAFETHAAKELEQKIAKLTYQKIQNVKQRIPITEIDEQIKMLKNNVFEVPEFSPKLLNKLVKELDYTKLPNSHLEKVKLQQLKNLSTFLKSQREYTELLERYNPGLTMKQDDKVRRTANRVGLSVPE